MASITIEMTDDELARVIKALCWRGGYDEGGEHVDVLPDAFAKQRVADWLSQTTNQVETERAIAQATASVLPPPSIIIT